MDNIIFVEGELITNIPKKLTRKEKLRIYNWNYRIKNRERFNNYKREYMRKWRRTHPRREKIKCECGREVLKSNISYHKKSKFHNKYMEVKENYVEI